MALPPREMQTSRRSNYRADVANLLTWMNSGRWIRILSVSRPRPNRRIQALCPRRWMCLHMIEWPGFESQYIYRCLTCQNFPKLLLLCRDSTQIFPGLVAFFSEVSPRAQAFISFSNLWDVEDYVLDPRDDEYSVDRMVDEDGEGGTAEASSSGGSLIGGSTVGISGRDTNVPVASVGPDEDQPWFTADFVEPKTRDRDILHAYQKGRMDGRWFEFLLPDPNHRASQPPPGYLSVYTRAFTAGMTLPIHPFVKDFCKLHGISPTQQAPNFWYIFASMWVLWSKKFDVELPLDEFTFVYKLCQVPKCEGWYFLGSYGRSEPKFGRLIKGLPSSSHGWKPMFFLVKGMFDVHPGDRPFKRKWVKRSFRILVSQDCPQLAGNRLARIEEAFNYSEDERHIKTFLTRENLEQTGLLLSLPDPDDTDAVKEFFHFTAGEMKTLGLRVPGDKIRSKKKKTQGPSSGAGDVIPPRQRAEEPSSQDTPRRKRPRHEETPTAGARSPPVIDITDAPEGSEAPPREETVLLPKGMYEFFFEQDWDSARRLSLFDRTRQQISLQIHAMDRTEERLKALLKKARDDKNEASEELGRVAEELWMVTADLKAAQEEITCDRKEAVDTKKALRKEAFDLGRQEGKNEGVEEFIASADFAQRNSKSAAKADFKSSDEFFDMRAKDMESVGQQIIAIINKHIPGLDLDFLYEPPSDDEGPSSKDTGSEGSSGVVAGDRAAGGGGDT
ncbi:hypothetical protein L484_026322 [Morus notabilis]|uniref:Transposase (putative) gypsy type domain-containing protein n=1 Tax=Morus notabilis TaxID=981085 RepID=W9R5Z2_9ROSA|nr:hypothetical protein L484_026322 [Morus notabilis]